MAKKTVASLQQTGKKYSKHIKFVKNKDGNYTTTERIVKYEDLKKELNIE